MGIMDAFSKEDRTEITVDQLITILNERAKAEANFYIAIKMCKRGVKPRNNSASIRRQKRK